MEATQGFTSLFAMLASQTAVLIGNVWFSSWASKTLVAPLMRAHVFPPAVLSAVCAVVATAVWLVTSLMMVGYLNKRFGSDR